MTNKWQFRGYKSAAVGELITDWYRGQSPKVKAKFKATMKFLNDNAITEWGKPAQNPRSKQLHGVLKGFREIRFFAGDIQHRPVGCFTGKNEFTILAFAVEQGDQLNPKPDNLAKVLKARLGEVRKDKEGYTHEW